jgi:hypothetical protein
MGAILGRTFVEYIVEWPVSRFINLYEDYVVKETWSFLTNLNILFLTYDTINKTGLIRDLLFMVYEYLTAWVIYRNTEY